MTTRHTRSRQTGSTLFLTLIMLVVLTIISLATLGTSLMELRMSNNAEFNMAANQSTQSVLEAAIAVSTNFDIANGAGSTNCSQGVSGCTSNTVVIPSPYDSGSKVVITRITDTDCPYRNSALATSCTSSKAALFDVYGKFDRSLYGQGQVEQNYGYAALYPVTQGNFTDTSGGTPQLSN